VAVSNPIGRSFIDVYLRLAPGSSRDLARQLGRPMTRAAEASGAGAGSRWGAHFGAGVRRGMGPVSRIVKSVAGSMKVAAVAAGVGLVAAGALAVRGVGKATKAASDLNETVNKTKAIFGGSFAEIYKWSKGSAKAMGLSRQEALSNAAAFGDMFLQLNIGRPAATNMSKKMVQLAADFASFSNADISDVLLAQQAAFRGEYDSLQRFVPGINAARVEQEALRMTHKKSAKDLTLAEKAQATYNIMLRDGHRATGDYARTANQLANTNRSNKAQWQDLTATVGKAFLPAQLLVSRHLGNVLLPTLGKLATKHGPAVQKALTRITAALLAALPSSNAMGSMADRLAKKLTLVPVGLSAMTEAMRGNGVTSDGFIGRMEHIGVAIRGMATWAKNFKTGGGWADLVARTKELGPQLRDAHTQIGSLSPVLKLAGAGTRFLADHIDTIVKHLPLLIAAFVAWKIAQAAANTAQAVTAALLPVQIAAQILHALALRRVAAAQLQLAAATRGTSTASLANVVITNQTTGAMLRGKAAAMLSKTATLAWAAAQKVAAIASAVFSVALRGVGLAMKAALGPVGLVIIGLTLLVAGLVFAYRHSDTFRRIVDGAWRTVAAAGLFLWGVLKKTLAGIGQAVVALIGVWKRNWHTFTAVLSVVWTVTKVIWKGIWVSITFYLNLIRAILRVALAAIRAVWGFVWGQVKAITEAVWKAIWEKIGARVKAIGANIRAGMVAIRLIWHTAWNAVRDFVTTTWTSIYGRVVAGGRKVKGYVHDLLTALRSGWRTGWGAIRDFVTSIWTSIKGRAVSGINKVIGVVNAFLRGVQRVGNLILPGSPIKLGQIPTISAGGAPNEPGRGTAGNPRAFRAGGVLPGNTYGPNTDTVPWVGVPGEMVIQRPSVKALIGKYGRGVLDHLNNAHQWARNKTGGLLQGLAAGGPIGRGPQTWRKIEALANSTGVPHTVISTIRPGATTHASGSLSYHATGHAVDFGGSGNNLARLFNAMGPLAGWQELIYSPMSTYIGRGVRKPIGMLDAITRGDHWTHLHAALLAGARGGSGPLIDFVGLVKKAIGKLLGPANAALNRAGGDSALGKLTIGAGRKVMSAAVTKAASIASAIFGGGGGRSGSLSAAENWIIQRESGGRTTADNPTSTAFGLGQLLLANRQRIGAMLGFSASTTDYGQQLAMFRQYVKERYGNAEAAQRFWQAHGWYDKGGYLPPGLSLAYNGTGTPERVLGPGQDSGALHGPGDLANAVADALHGAAVELNGQKVGELIVDPAFRELRRMIRGGKTA
jgi:hypothetical protein